MEPAETQRLWFDNSGIVDYLPRLYRWYSAYCRMMHTQRSWRIVGGSFLFRRLIACSKILDLPDHAVVTLAGAKVAVDLRDSRMFDVFGEIERSGAEFHVLSTELSPGDTFL